MSITGNLDGTVKLNGDTVTPVVEGGTATFTTVVPSNPAYTGDAWWWDYEFNGTVTSIGSDKGGMTTESAGNSVYTTADSSGNRELYFQQTPWRDASFSDKNELTAVMYCAPGNYANTVLVGFGSTTQGDQKAIALVTGANPAAGEMKLVLTDGHSGSAAGTVTELADLTAVGATTTKHLYAFVMDRITEDETTKTRVRVYLDGKVKAIYKHNGTLTLSNGFQIGSLHGGVYPRNNFNTGLSKYPASGDSGTLDFLRVINGTLTDDAMSALAEAYPYNSEFGKATRAPVSGAANWVETDVWTQTVPGQADATQGEPNLDTNVTISKDGASDVSVAINLTQDSYYESLTLAKEAGATGSLKLTSGYGNATSGKLVSAETSVLTDTTVPGGRVHLGVTSIADGITLTVDPYSASGNYAIYDTLTGLGFGEVYESVVISMALLGDGASVVLDSTSLADLTAKGFTAELVYNPDNLSYTFKVTREEATADIAVNVTAGGEVTWSTRGVAVPAPASIPDTYTGTVTVNNASTDPVTIATAFAGGNIDVASGSAIFTGAITTSGTVDVEASLAVGGATAYYSSLADAVTAFGTSEGTLTLRANTASALTLVPGQTLVAGSFTTGGVSIASGNDGYELKNEDGTYTLVDNRTSIWNPTDGNAWSTAANWSTGYVPTQYTEVTFNDGATVSYSDHVKCGGIVVNGTVAITGADKKDVELYGNITGSGTLNINTVCLKNRLSSSISVNPTVNLTDCAFAGAKIEFYGAVAINGNFTNWENGAAFDGVLTLGRQFTINGGTFNLWDNATVVLATANATLTDSRGTKIDISKVSTTVADSYVKQVGNVYSVDAYNTVTISATENVMVTATKTTQIEDGETVTLTITPSTGYYVTGVVVDGVTTPTSETSYDITVNADTTVSATVAIYTYTLTVPEVANATATVTVGGVEQPGVVGEGETVYTFDYGTAATVAYTADTYYEITSDNATQNFTIGANTAAVAPTVERSNVNVTIPTVLHATVTDLAVSEGTYKLVGQTPDGFTVSVYAGTTVTITWTAQEGYFLTSTTTTFDVGAADVTVSGDGLASPQLIVAKRVSDNTPYASIEAALVANFAALVNGTDSVLVIDDAEAVNAYGGYGIGYDAVNKIYAQAVAVVDVDGTTDDPGYLTVQEAVDAAAETSATVTLKADNDEDLTLANNKTVTIINTVGNETYTYTAPVPVTEGAYTIDTTEVANGATYAARDWYSWTVTVDAENATVTGIEDGDTVSEANPTITFTVTPDQYYSVSEVTANGTTLTPVDDEYHYTLEGNVTIAATATRDQVTVTVPEVIGTTVSVTYTDGGVEQHAAAAGAYTVDKGTAVTVAWTASENYAVTDGTTNFTATENVTVGSAGAGSLPTVKATAATWIGYTEGNYNVAANWSSGIVPTKETVVTIPAGDYTIRAKLDENHCKAMVLNGNVTLTSTSDQGNNRHFIFWGDNGVAVSGNGTLKLGHYQIFNANTSGNLEIQSNLVLLRNGEGPSQFSGNGSGSFTVTGKTTTDGLTGSEVNVEATNGRTLTFADIDVPSGSVLRFVRNNSSYYNITGTVTLAPGPNTSSRTKLNANDHTTISGSVVTTGDYYVKAATNSTTRSYTALENPVVTVTSDAHVAVTGVENGQQVAPGTVLTITVTPDEDYVATLTVGGATAIDGTAVAASYQYTMTESDVTIAATSALNTTTFTVTVPAHATIVSVSNATDNGDGTYTATIGATVTVTFAAEEGYFLSGETTKSVTVTAGMEPIEADSSMVVNATVAMIDTTPYASLQAALDAISGETEEVTIELLADATLDLSRNGNVLGDPNVTKITIDGNDNTLTFVRSETWAQVNTDNDATLVLKNVELVAENSATYNQTAYDKLLENPNHNLAFSCPVELNNVTSSTALSFFNNATLDTVTVEESANVYAIWIHTSASTVDIDDLVITAPNGRGIKVDDTFVEAWGGTPSPTAITVNDAEFTTKYKAAVLVRSNYETTVAASGTIDISGVLADTTNLVWVDEASAASYNLVTVTGATKDVESANYVATVSVNNAITGYCKTLAEAFNAAPAGATVTVIADNTMASTIQIYRNVTLDLNGKTVTGPSNATVFIPEDDIAFTITDTSDLQNGKVCSAAKVVLAGNRLCTFTLEAGTLESSNVPVYLWGAEKTGYRVVINGGTVKSTTSTYTDCAIYAMYGSITFNDGVLDAQVCNGFHSQTIRVNGGTVKVRQNGKLSGLNNSDFQISGGTFYNVEPAENNIVSGKIAAETSTGVWEVRNGSWAAEVDGKKYETFAEAWDAVSANSTLKLRANQTLTASLVVAAGKTVALDLNGFTLTSTVDPAVENRGTLTVFGGTITATGNDVFDNYGTLTVTGGTYTGGWGIVNYAEASATVEGGTFTCTEHCVLAFRNDSEITISGGTFTSTDNAVVADHGLAGRDGNVITITGGTFNGSVTSEGYSACGIYVANNDTVNVSGGTFNITGGCGILARAGVVNVTGGSFTTTGNTTGKVGDSRVVVPCAAVVYDSAANYPGYDVTTTGIELAGGTFESAVAPVQVVKDADDAVTVKATTNTIAVPEGYRWYETATAGVYELAAFYTITWDFDNGAEPQVDEIKAGESVTAPADPSKEGYTFTGWTPAIVTPAVADATYTAVFEEDQAPVTDGIKIDTIIDAESGLDTEAVNTEVVICTEGGTPISAPKSASGSDYVANDVSVAVGETKYFKVVQGETESAVYGVTSPNTTKKLNIVAVPFAAIGEDSTDVAIEKIIDTGKLNNGDKVYAYSASGDTYNVWQLDVVGSDKTWQPLWMVKIDDNSDASVITEVPFEDARVARGSAFWVEIAPGNDSQIVLIGKVATAPATKTIAVGTALEPKFQLCASPKAAAFDLNGTGAFTGDILATVRFAEPGDTIQLTVDNGAPIVFYYKGGKWGRRVESTWKPGDPGTPPSNWNTENATIPAGCGFWYISRGGTPTINW